jgi:ketosteroid isomerase-like protein
LQAVEPPDGKPAIETHGKMLLVLHRASDGQWHIECEMWNPGTKRTESR